MTTPPVEPINESNDSTVARCCEGIMSFRYAWRMGMSAAKIRPHRTSSTSATQNEPVRPSNPRMSALATAPRMSAVVRFRNSERILGAAKPPRICDPATIAAARPATV